MSPLKVLVLDTVHGAAAICEGYLAKGCEVTAVDVYHITPEVELGRLKLVAATRAVLASNLGLLGVSAPERM